MQANQQYHPTAEQLSNYALGKLAESDSLGIEAHLVDCKACCGIVASIPNDGFASLFHSSETSSGGSTYEETDLFEPGDSVSDSSISSDPVAASAQPEEMPERLGDYRILKVLGAGGMGVVYLAEDEKLDRQVALKVMKQEVALNPVAKDRFLREARAVAALDHDHIVPIYQVGEEQGAPFIAMPLLQGMSLSKLLSRGQKLKPAQMLRIGRETALGLQAAHDMGLIHRDIKPANLWIEPRNGGRVKILDFGLARGTEESTPLTSSGIIVGTPSYMAPEQAQGEQVDARADLFSLGCVLYQLCTGRPPFQGRTAIETLIQVATIAPDPISSLNNSIPVPFCQLIDSLMSKKAEDRPASAREVAQRIREIEKDLEQQSATHFQNNIVPPSQSPSSAAARVSHPVAKLVELKAPSSSGRKRLVLAAVLLILFGAGVFAAFQLFGRYKTPQGTFVVEINDPKVEARFKNGRILIYNDKGDLLYTLLPDQRNKKLPPGKYRIQVKGADGLELSSETFAIRNGKDFRVRVTMEPSGKPSVPPKKVVTRSPLDDLRRHRIPQYERSVAGFGNAGQAPKELVAILGHSNLKHWGQVHDVAFSPNGKTLASASGDGTVKLWDVETLQEKQVLLHDSPVYGIAYSPDGKRLVSGSHSGLRLWNPESGEMLRETKGSYGKVKFSPSGDMVAAIHADWVTLWFVPTWKEWKRFRLTRAISDTAFDSELKRLITCSHTESTVKVWSLTDGKELRSWKTPEPPEHVLFTPNGENVIVHVRYRLRMWSTKTWKERENWDFGKRKFYGALTFNPAGKLLCTVSERGNHEVASYDPDSEEIKPIVLVRDGKSQYALDSSPNGKLIAVGHRDGRVILYDTQSGENLLNPKGHRNGITSMATGRGGKLIATGGTDKTVRLWELCKPVPQARWVLKGHKERITAVALSLSGEILISGDSAGEVRVWSTSTGKQISEAQQQGAIRAIALSHNGKQMAISSTLSNGEVTIAEVSTGKVIHTCKGHRGTVYAIAYSPNGKELATAGFDGQIKLWDSKTGKAMKDLQAQGSAVLALAFHRNGELLAAACENGTTYLWKSSDAKVNHRLTGHQKPVTGVAFGNNGKSIFTGSQDGTVRAWETATGKEIDQLSSLGAVVAVQSASETGHLVTASSQDSRPRFWTIPSLEEALHVPGQKSGTAMGQQSWAAIAPDSRTCFSMVQNDTVIRWDLSSGTKLREYPPSKVAGCALHPDGSLIACVGEGGILLLDVETGRREKLLPGEAPYSVRFSPDGSLLAVGGASGHVAVWETKTWTKIHALKYKNWINAIAISPDNRHLAVALHQAPKESIIIEDLATKKVTHRLPSSSGTSNLAFSPNGSTLASGYSENYGTVTAWWNVETGRLIKKTKGSYNVFVVSVAYSSDGGAIAGAYTDGHVRLWSASNGELLREIKIGPSHGKVHHVQFAPDGRHLLTMNGNATVYVLRLTEADPEAPNNIASEPVKVKEYPQPSIKPGEPLNRTALVRAPTPLPGAQSWTIAHKYHFGSFKAQISPNGKILVTGDLSGTVRLWDIKSGTMKGALVYGTTQIDALAWSPDSRYLAAGESSAHGRGTTIWDVTTQKVVHKLRGSGALSWSRKGNRLACYNQSSRLQVHDIMNGKQIVELTPPKPDLRCPIALSSDGLKLVAASPDHLLYLWDLETGKITHRLQGHQAWINAVSWSPDNELILSTGDDRTVRCWDAKTGKEISTTKIPFPGESLAVRQGKPTVIAQQQMATVLEPVPGLSVLVGSYEGSSVSDTPAGQFFAGSASHGFGLIDLRDSTNRITLDSLFKVTHYSPPWSANGSMVAVRLHNHRIYVWSTRSLKALTSIPVPNLRIIAWAGDNERIAVTTASSEIIQLWNAKIGKSLGSLSGHTGDISRIAWAPQGDLVASGSTKDKTIRIWDARSRKQLYGLKTEDYVISLAWSPNGKWLAHGKKKAIDLINPKTGKVERTIQAAGGLSVAWSDDSEYLAAGFGKEKEEWNTHLGVWRVSDGALISEIKNVAGAYADSMLIEWKKNERSILLSTSYQQRFFEWHPFKRGAEPAQLPNEVISEVVVGAPVLSPDQKHYVQNFAGGVRFGTLEGNKKDQALLLPIKDRGWIAISAEGHYQGSPGAEKEIVYVVQTAKGQETLSPEEFARRFGWKNDPRKVRLRHSP